jgi:DNA polymerase III subunit epsilon
MVWRPIFYDTETTGLSPEKDRIIELAAYDPLRKKTFCELVNPERLIPDESIAITHITNEMVKEAPTFAEVGKRFLDFCQGDVVLIAHNNDAFDMPFLAKEFERCFLSLPKWPTVDSLKWARKYRPDLPKHSLQYLREVYEIPGNQAHRALNDVVTLYRVFVSMCDDLTLDVILELMKSSLPQSSSAEIRHMPFGKYQGTPLEDVPRGYIQWLQKNGVFDKEENASLKKAFEKRNLLEGASL